MEVNCRKLYVLSVVKCFGGKVSLLSVLVELRSQEKVSAWPVYRGNCSNVQELISLSQKKNLHAQAYRNTLTHLFVMELWILFNVSKMPLKGFDECQFLKAYHIYSSSDETIV